MYPVRRQTKKEWTGRGTGWRDFSFDHYGLPNPTFRHSVTIAHVYILYRLTIQCTQLPCCCVCRKRHVIHTGLTVAICFPLFSCLYDFIAKKGPEGFSHVMLPISLDSRDLLLKKNVGRNYSTIDSTFSARAVDVLTEADVLLLRDFCKRQKRWWRIEQRHPCIRQFL